MDLIYRWAGQWIAGLVVVADAPPTPPVPVPTLARQESSF